MHIETQPVPEHVAAAMGALERISVEDPDLDAALRAELAVATLRATWPPYPPPVQPAQEVAPLPAVEAIGVADAALGRAIDVAGDAAAAVRFAAARAALCGESLAVFPW